MRARSQYSCRHSCSRRPFRSSAPPTPRSISSIESSTPRSTYSSRSHRARYYQAAHPPSWHAQAASAPPAPYQHPQRYYSYPAPSVPQYQYSQHAPPLPPQPQPQPPLPPHSYYDARYAQSRSQAAYPHGHHPQAVSYEQPAAPIVQAQGQAPPVPLSREITERDVADIFLCARFNRLDQLEELFRVGVPVNVRDSYGNTVLIVACQNGHKRVAKATLRRGADINAKNVSSPS
jgi:hypothetical protein